MVSWKCLKASLHLQVHRLEKQVKTLLHSDHRNSAGPDDGTATRELRERVSNLESSSRLSARSLFNMSRQLVALDKLHLSLLQLLESVESLENKVDRGLPDLQREISKMEFGRAQITSTSALLKEEVENQRASVKALSVGVSALQEKTDKDHSRLSEVQEQLKNLSSSLQDHKVQSVPVPQVVALVSSNDTLTSLVQDLSKVQSEYRDIVSRLPHVYILLIPCRLFPADCGSTGGGRGLSLIAPGPGGPLVAWCAEEGWTVVQRRVDGSQEFNRNWSDYQTGFGSPAGEFWLGNEPLHRLTSDNCSQLRVDLQDIYGKRWRAEYSEFSVSGDHDGYRLHVTGYRGNASDALDYQNRMQFSAIDSDRDISNTHCAANYEGGWWFSHCQHANLNGRYNLGLTWFDAAKNEWIAVAWSEMKVRRREGCEGRT
ncbi:unnamed protein product [Timema podura]|uniref:Fibrinogen C-terminal domain-containing protein n=1 Tax=Timema podura TaxID=61482 RepID=A0ABN7NME2_TIMPD|nr:unnamed protein product [Timema podura]